MYIRLVAEITSHLFQALTSSLSLSLAPSLFSTFFSFPGPVSVSVLSLSLSLSPPSFNPQPVYSDKEHEGTVLGRIPSISRNSSEKSP